MYKIAVIIPTLNEERFIAQCLDSVIAQSYPFVDMDVMVVDGGSIDKTREIVWVYQKKYSNIRLLHNPRKIQSAAFNIGVHNSDAKYIVRLDAHAFYKPFYIEGCIKGLMDDSQRGNVGGRWDIQPQDNSIWAVTSAILNHSKFGIGGACYRVGSRAGNVDTVPFGAFPRKLIDDIGGMREDLPRGEDNEYNYRIKKAGYNIYFDPAIECIYYSRPTLYALCQQMYANGKSIGHLLHLNSGTIGYRHLVPLMFVVSIIMGVIFSLVWFPLFYIFIFSLGVYFFCDILASFNAAKKNGCKYFIPLFVMFFCIHLSYGWGTVIGLFTGIKLGKSSLLYVK